MSPLRMAFDEFRAKKVDTDHFRLLLAQTQDVDEVDLEGVTLLELASGLHASNVVPFARVLLHAGANRGIKNNGGGDSRSYVGTVRDFQHAAGLWRRLEKRQGMVQLLVEFIARGASPYGSWQDCSPTDFAALSPAALGLWFQVLEKAGIDIEEVLQNDDQCQGLRSPDSDEVEWVLGDVTSPHLVSPDLLCDTRPPLLCQRCGLGNGPFYYRPPFDMALSTINPELKNHTIWYRHDNGISCDNIGSREACTKGPHDSLGAVTVYVTYLSVRRWAGYWLWRNGYLENSEDAEFWATNVITQEALDSFDHLSALRL